MTNRLILVEGMPGSGKTTISTKIKDHLINKGLNVILYNEGDFHPADMAWNALFTKEEYDNLIKENKEYEQVIKENSVLEDDYVIVSYTKLDLSKNNNELMKNFEGHEVYDGRVSFETFKNIHLTRWKKFSDEMKESENEIVIFECAFLQNHINELLAVHEKDVQFIKEYLKELIETVKGLNPKLIYLNQDSVKETLSRVAKERISDNKEMHQDWIDMIIEYFQNSNYGNHNNIKGLDGVVRYFEKRQEIELKVIDNLSIDQCIITNYDYDWEAIINKITKEQLAI
jgi:uridine kinase